MKLAKLSLAAITVVSLTASAFAADTLAGAFKEGKVSGVLKSYYMDSTYSLTGKADKGAYAVGGALNYATGSFNGLSAGFQFQTSHTLGVTVGGTNDGSVGIGVNLLSEAYLAYSVNDTTLKVGRQHIGTPLVANSGSRLIRDYFMAATVVNTSLPNTTLVAGAVTQHTGRDGTVGIPDAPIYTAYLATKVSGVNIVAQYVYSSSYSASRSDASKDYYGAATYAFNNFNVGVQYTGFNGVDTSGNPSYSSNSLNLKAGVNVAGFALGVGYATTSNSGDVRGGWGNGNNPAWNSIQILGSNNAGTDTYLGRVSYDFAQVGINGLSTGATYAKYRGSVVTSNNGGELDLSANYSFGAALKGLSTVVQYATTSMDTSSLDSTNLRFKVNYNF